jgi:hypothetical protein
MGWMFLSDGTIDEVDLDLKTTTGLRAQGPIWEPIAPWYWASAKVWRPRWFGHGPGEIGGVLFGSPAGLYAWDGSTLSVPGGPAPDWLTNADTAIFPTATTMPAVTDLPGIYTMEVYNQRLFVAGKNVIAWSAPGNGADYIPEHGGGAFGYFGDKLVYTFTDLAEAAGFLYCFGDSSTYVISNIQVQQTGTQVAPLFATFFDFANVDPQVGHGFPRPVGHWGRGFVIANGAPLIGGDISEARAHRGGIYMLYGGEAKLIGQKTTNVYTTLDVTDYFVTIAPASIFGFRVMLVNGRFTDPWGRVRNLLLMWHGTLQTGEFWSVASQNLELTNVGTYEQDSVLSPYGTDGTNLYRLFSRPDPALPKRLSTKAYRGTGPSSLNIKLFSRVFCELHDHDGGGVHLTGRLTTSQGGLPNGSEDMGFSLNEGEIYGIKPWPTSGAGINGAIDLESISPDFTLERVQVVTDDRTRYGA